jgi:hypothetical protein
VATGLAVALLSAAAFGYVWHFNRNEKLQEVIRQKQSLLYRMRAESDVLDGRIEAMRSHRAIEARVKDLGLVPPQPEQILRLPEILADGREALTGRQRPGAVAAVSAGRGNADAVPPGPSRTRGGAP